jgi:nitrite reductase (NADH) large subunit
VTVKDIGVMAIQGGWEVYVGGAAGMRVRKTDLLVRVEHESSALEAAHLFLQYYRENAEYLERTMPFVARVGLETIQTAVLDPEQGDPEGLYERFKIAKAASDPDPWRERRAPAVPKQFEELDSEATPIGPPEGAEITASATGGGGGGAARPLMINRVEGRRASGSGSDAKAPARQESADA